MCPCLQDLEFFDEDIHEHNGLVLRPERDLDHLRTTLRRLCYSACPTTDAPDAEERSSDDDSWDGPEGPDGAYRKVKHVQERLFRRPEEEPEPQCLDFSAFPVLEQLELGQVLLYGPVFPTAPGDHGLLRRSPTTSSAGYPRPYGGCGSGSSPPGRPCNGTSWGSPGSPRGVRGWRR